MPIKPENRSRYPADWPAISRAAKERAGWKCQHPGCAAGQYEVGLWRLHDGAHQWHRIGRTGSTYSEARQHAAEADFARSEEGPRPTIIVLTVAHLNHQPEDCRPENLAAMCQRHHLAYDHDHHRANAQATRRAKAGTLELF
jgi:hypothetical protein